jgi:hypothetical protein
MLAISVVPENIA